jgi:hypothetical protein
MIPTIPTNIEYPVKKMQGGGGFLTLKKRSSGTRVISFVGFLNLGCSIR